MVKCSDCEYYKYCLATMNDLTVTGCEMTEYMQGKIPYNAIRIEKTIREKLIENISNRKRAKRGRR